MGNVITINSKSAAGGNVAKLMSPTDPQVVADGSQKLPVHVQKAPSQQTSVAQSSASNGLPVPSPVNTVISIPNVVKPEVETKQEGK